MSIEFDPQRFCDFAERRSEVTFRNPHNILATAYKNRRLELNLTLDEATKDICSKAYLCKFENNQIDMQASVAKALCERVTLDYEKIVTVIHDDNLTIAVRLYLFNQFEQIGGLCERIDHSVFIASNKLLELFYNLAKCYFEKCESLIMEIDKVKSTLTDFEFIAFAVCIVEYYIKTNQFLKGKEFISNFSYEFNSKELKYLYLEQQFCINFNLGIVNDAFQSFKLLDKEFSNGYPRKREFLDKLQYLEMFATQSSINELKDMIDDYLPDDYIEDYWYTYCVVLAKANQFSDCLKVIQKYELKNAKFVAIYAYCTNEMAKNPTKTTLLNLIPSKRIPSKIISFFNSLVEEMEKNHLNLIDRNFIKLMQLELIGSNTEDLIEFLRDVALKYDKMYQHRFYSNIYAHQYFEYLGSISRYKDAYLVAKNDRTFK